MIAAGGVSTMNDLRALEHRGVSAVLLGEALCNGQLDPHAVAMQASLATTLGVEPGAVAIKGKTNEGVDATGRGEALAVHAVALISRAQP